MAAIPLVFWGEAIVSAFVPDNLVCGYGDLELAVDLAAGEAGGLTKLFGGVEVAVRHETEKVETVVFPADGFSFTSSVFFCGKFEAGGEADSQIELFGVVAEDPNVAVGVGDILRGALFYDDRARSHLTPSGASHPLFARVIVALGVFSLGGVMNENEGEIPGLGVALELTKKPGDVILRDGVFNKDADAVNDENSGVFWGVCKNLGNDVVVG